MAGSEAETYERPVAWQRGENAVIAVGVVVTVIALEQPWWVLPAAFLAFDLSALGYGGSTSGRAPSATTWCTTTPSNT